eukprot:Blabericola_migrator_1__635@NODE_1159_length_5253_cov_60_233899_g789_i0_p3_GENE_NODE_1159_length_5253_cov_60_233899_g789_i0NODE_1159_length_5253_cov_60_233899_g789_i0_p3_ORF_typecomplete_len244_score39_10_NODE_1159_length_5253_cov_60_233899_g789_i025063237
MRNPLCFIAWAALCAGGTSEDDEFDAWFFAPEEPRLFFEDFPEVALQNSQQPPLERHLRTAPVADTKEKEQRLIFPSQLNNPSYFPLEDTVEQQDSAYGQQKATVSLVPGPPWLQEDRLLEETVEPPSTPLRLVDELAETASRWSNLAAAGTVNHANMMNNLRHQTLDWWLDLATVAENRARAYTDPELLKKTWEVQRNLFDAWGRLGDRVIQKTAKAASHVTDHLYTTYMNSGTMPDFLNSL